jgi:phospholipid transport system substrate-binding protein
MKLIHAMMAAALLATGLGSGLALAADSIPAPAPVSADDPSKLVQAAAEGMLKELDANRDAFRKDPSKLNPVIEKYLLPHFDTQYSARLVLGKHWRDATEDQRKRFVDAFYQSLLYTYGDAMIDFTADRLKVLPTKVAPTDERATVRTEIKRSNGTKVGVNYSLRKVNGEWKAWDVVIDGISYVKSYREDYGAEVQQKGLDAVIARLEDKAKTAKATKVKTT